MQISKSLRKTTNEGSMGAIGRIFAAAAAVLIAATSLTASAQTSGAYTVTNLVSDGSVAAGVTDPGFINPWAISASGTWWISTAGSGFNYVVASTPNPGTLNFKVIVPQASGTSPGFPSGSVTTAGATGMILPNGTKASFLFSTLDGTISGWNSKLGTANAVTQIVIDNSASGAEYTGLAIVNTTTTSNILAANFGSGNAIEVYDSTFKPTKLAGTFTDPNLPAGYAPFSVHVLNNQVYVAYALRSSKAPFRTVDAVGNGVVSLFDISGNFISRVVTGGNLDSPWGIAFAPNSFGIFGGSLLIGNFGNGMINAYDPVGHRYQGQLIDKSGNPLSYASLWELLAGGTTVGNTTSVSGGSTSAVYFTAGLASEAHGLFAAITNDTSSGGTPAFAVSAATGALTVVNGSQVETTLSIAPLYGFTNNVSLACSGLPAGTSCSFSQTPISPSGTAPSLINVIFQTSKSSAFLRNTQGRLTGVAYALLLPFASFVIFWRRRSGSFNTLIRLALLCGVSFAVLGASACSNSTPTPPGTSTVTITATSGTVSHAVTLQLTVQ